MCETNIVLINKWLSFLIKSLNNILLEIDRQNLNGM